MRIVKVKKTIFFLLMIVIMAVVSGCVRYPGEPGHEPGETNYQLKITVEVKGEINIYDGIYYIGLDTDQTGIGPGSDIGDWEGYYYYVKLDSMSCYLYPKEEGPAILLSYSISDIGSKLQVTIALSDLEDPDSIDINVLTTDSENITYDYLDNYFPINTTVLYSTGEGISSNDLEDDEADFDIRKVTAEITN